MHNTMQKERCKQQFNKNILFACTVKRKKDAREQRTQQRQFIDNCLPVMVYC